MGEDKNVNTYLEVLNSGGIKSSTSNFKHCIEKNDEGCQIIKKHSIGLEYLSPIGSLGNTILINNINESLNEGDIAEQNSNLSQKKIGDISLINFTENISKPTPKRKSSVKKEMIKEYVLGGELLKEVSPGNAKENYTPKTQKE